jgi:hypothetical protein
LENRRRHCGLKANANEIREFSLHPHIRAGLAQKVALETATGREEKNNQPLHDFLGKAIRAD